MAAIVVLCAFLGSVDAPPSAAELVAVLRASDNRPPQVVAQIREDERWPQAAPRAGAARSRLIQEHTFLCDSGNEVHTWLFGETPVNPALRDEVVGRNDRYQFQLYRLSANAAWQLSGVTPIERADAGNPPTSIFWPLFFIREWRLADLIENAEFETTIRPAILGGCVVEGQRRDGGHGFRSYRAEVRVTTAFAYIREASYVWTSAERRDEWRGENRVRVERVPILELTQESLRIETDGRSQTTATEKSFQVRLSVDDADRVQFRLPHYGLPEPSEEALNPPPVVPRVVAPPAGRAGYTWLLLLPVAGILLLLVGRWLSRRGKVVSGGSTPPA